MFQHTDNCTFMLLKVSGFIFALYTQPYLLFQGRKGIQDQKSIDLALKTNKKEEKKNKKKRKKKKKKKK